MAYLFAHVEETTAERGKAMPVPEGTQTELKIAWENAWSIPPGERPRGEYIGNVKTEYGIYYFYKENNNYWYETEYSRQQAEKQSRVKRQQWENGRKYGYYRPYG